MFENKRTRVIRPPLKSEDLKAVKKAVEDSWNTFNALPKGDVAREALQDQIETLAQQLCNGGTGPGVPTVTVHVGSCLKQNTNGDLPNPTLVPYAEMRIGCKELDNKAPKEYMGALIAAILDGLDHGPLRTAASGTTVQVSVSRRGHQFPISRIDVPSVEKSAEKFKKR